MKQEWTWEDECNLDGTMDGSIGFFSKGGRELDRAYFELTKTGEDEECYHVRAVCTESELRTITQGEVVEFDLPKECSLWEVNHYLESAVEEYIN